MRKRQTFLVGAFLLAIGGFLARAIGAIYKIPLANILGSNGMGVYYLIFPLYSMLLVFISSGVSIAVSKLISYERANNNKKNEVNIFKVALIYVFAASMLFSVVLIVLSDALSLWQGNANAGLGYVAIAPALVFASLIAVVRAYFQGLQNMIPTSLSNVTEQIVKLVFGLLLANLFLQRGVTYAVFGAILAVTISEFVAFVIILLNYWFYKKKNNVHEKKEITSPTLTVKQICNCLFRYALPATLSSAIVPITAFLDSFMIINLLVQSGQSTALATSLYGINNGVVNTLISLPVIFTMALSTAIVPNLSGLHAKNNATEVGFKSSFFIKLAWIFSFFCCIMLLVLAPDVVQMLYSKGLTDKVIDEFSYAYKLLMVSSISIVYYAFLHTFTSILQSINKPSVPFVSMGLALLVRLGLVVVLIQIPSLNIFGVVIANVVFLTIATLLNLRVIRKCVCLKFDFMRLLALPVFAGVVAALATYVVKILLFNHTVTFVYVPVCGVVGLLVYGGLLLGFQVFTPKEKKLFPQTKKITKSKRRVV